MPDSPDNLELGVGITGVEQFDQDMSRVQRIVKNARENIDQNWDASKFKATKFGETVIDLEKKVATLARQYAGVGKAGAAGFEEISQKQQAALTTLTDVAKRLREIDIEVSQSGVKKSTLTERTKEVKALRDQIGLLARDLPGIQTLDVVLKAKLVPEIARPKPDTLFTPDQANDELLRRAKRAYQLENQIRNFSPRDSALAGFSKTDLGELEAVQTRITQIRQLLSTTTDNNLITQLNDELKQLDRRLTQVDESFVQLKSLDLKSNVVNTQKPYTEDTDLYRSLTRQEKAVFALEQQLTKLSRLNYRGSDQIAKQATDALNRLNPLSNRIVQIQQQLNNTTDRNLITQLTREAKALDNVLSEVERDLLRVRRTELANPNPRERRGYGLLSQVADGLNIPGIGAGAIGVAGGITAAIYGGKLAFDYAQQAIEKAGEAAKANRLLAASAAEAGLRYDDLSQANKSFAERAGLSNVAATELTAKITQLATKGNRPQDVAKLQEGFLNLGAARGLDAGQLRDVIQQIITGQDEGYKKLLLPNPSELYKDYAEKNRRTVGSLTAVEKTQIFEEKFLEKAALFNGTAEARMESIDGRAAKLSASFQNLGTSLGTAFAGNVTVIQTIDELTAAFRSLSSSIDELYNKQKGGAIITDKEIAALADKNDIIQAAAFVRNSAFGAGGSILQQIPLLNRIPGLSGFTEGSYSTGAGMLFGNDQSNREDIVRRQLNAQKLADARAEQNRKDAEEMQKRIQAEEEARRKSGLKEREYLRIFQSARSTTDQIRAIRDSFTYNETTEDYEGPLFAEKNFEYYQKAIKTLSTRAKKTYDLLFNSLKSSEQDIRDAIGRAGSDKELDEQDQEAVVEAGRRELSQRRERTYRQLLGDPRKTEKELRDAVTKIKADTELEENTQIRLLEDADKEIINAVERRYRRLIQDLNIRAKELLQNITDIKSDKTLTEDKREGLTREAEAKLKTQREQVDRLQREFRRFIIDTAGESNPMVKALGEVETAAEAVYDRFKDLGPEFAAQAATIAGNSARARAALVLFDSSDQALRFRQEARREEQRPDTQTNAFERRLQQVSERVNFLTSDAVLGREASLDRFYGSEFKFDKSGRAERSPLAKFFEQQYGQEAFRELQKGIRGVPKEEQRAFLETSIKIKNAFQDIASLKSVDILGTGILGQEAVAKSLLDRLPTREELLPRLSRKGRTREEAQELFQERAAAEETLQAAGRKRFRDFIANQRFIDLNRRDAEERVQNLGVNGKDLQDREKLDKFLAIVNELGTAELTPQLRQAKIRVLNARAELEEKQRIEAARIMDNLGKTMDTIKTQIEGNGLKVDLSEKPLIELNINLPLGGSSTETGTRPGLANVKKKYG